MQKELIKIFPIWIKKFQTAFDTGWLAVRKGGDGSEMIKIKMKASVPVQIRRCNNFHLSKLEDPVFHGYGKSHVSVNLIGGLVYCNKHSNTIQERMNMVETNRGLIVRVESYARLRNNI